VSRAGFRRPSEAPVLTGQHTEYITRQLEFFSTNARRNDIYRRMRDIAARLSQDEIRRLGAYYQGIF
jgi:cytochrome c553